MTKAGASSRDRTLNTGPTVAPFMALAIVLACESGTAGDDGAVDRDSAGTRIIENRLPEPPVDAPLRISESPLLTIGAVSAANPAFEFTDVQGATRLSDGRIVVVDAESDQVRWFDAEGRHLLTRGGAGSAPFEFNYPSKLIRLPGDTVIVEDRPRIHHVFFGPDGEFKRREELDRSRARELIGPMTECSNATSSDRSLVFCVPEAGQPEIGPRPGPGHLRRFSRYVRVPWTLDRVDTLGLYGGLEQWGIEYGGRVNFVIHPFHSRTVLATGGFPPQTAIAINPAYSIEVWGSDGALSHIVRLAGARRAPTQQARDSVREQMRMFARGDEALLNRAVAEIEEPDSLPSISGLFIDDLSYLWVRPWSQRAGEWTVFDPGGRLLGDASLPVGFRPFEIGDDYVLGVRWDESHVPFIELYGVERSSG